MTFIPERSKQAVRAYLAKPDIQREISGERCQIALREALQVAHEYLEQHRQASVIHDQGTAIINH
jgi:hypothetical protein